MLRWWKQEPSQLSYANSLINEFFCIQSYLLDRFVWYVLSSFRITRFSIQGHHMVSFTYCLGRYGLFLQPLGLEIGTRLTPVLSREYHPTNPSQNVYPPQLLRSPYPYHTTPTSKTIHHTQPNPTQPPPPRLSSLKSQTHNSPPNPLY